MQHSTYFSQQRIAGLLFVEISNDRVHSNHSIEWDYPIALNVF